MTDKKRILQIDDSGWGSLLGGVMIGVYNTESKKSYCRLIPVKAFQGRTFAKKKYLDTAYEIAVEGLTVLAERDLKFYDIQVCRGFALSKVRDWFERNPQYYKSVSFEEIKNPFQTILEEKFAISLGRYKIPKKSKGAHRMSFDDMLAWIKRDKKRVKYVKTGWNSWKTRYKNQK